MVRLRDFEMFGDEWSGFGIVSFLFRLLPNPLPFSLQMGVLIKKE